MIEYNDRTQTPFLLLCHMRGSVLLRSFFYALPATLIATCLQVFQVTAHQKHLEPVTPGLFAWGTFLLTTCLGLRLNRAMARFWEGASLLHQMQGEWFESASCLFAFSRRSLLTRKMETQHFRETLVRLISCMSASALEEIHCNPDVALERIDQDGLSDETLEYVNDSKDVLGFNREQVILHMIQVLMTQAHHDGIVDIAPPILSRVYQTLSRGLVHAINAKKITTTFFPFPIAQAITSCLATLSVTLPFFVNTMYPSSFVGSTGLTYFPLYCFFVLNFSATEHEEPFGDRDNNLDLQVFQDDMNRGLLMLLNHKSDSMAKCKARVTKGVSVVDLMDKSDAISRRLTRISISRAATKSNGLKSYLGLAGKLKPNGETEMSMSMGRSMSQRDRQSKVTFQSTDQIPGKIAIPALTKKKRFLGPGASGDSLNKRLSRQESEEWAATPFQQSHINEFWSSEGSSSAQPGMSQNVSELWSSTAQPGLSQNVSEYWSSTAQPGLSQNVSEFWSSSNLDAMHDEETARSTSSPSHGSRVGFHLTLPKSAMKGGRMCKSVSDGVQFKIPEMIQEVSEVSRTPSPSPRSPRDRAMTNRAMTMDSAFISSSLGDVPRDFSALARGRPTSSVATEGKAEFLTEDDRAISTGSTDSEYKAVISRKPDLVFSPPTDPLSQNLRSGSRRGSRDTVLTEGTESQSMLAALSLTYPRRSSTMGEDGSMVGMTLSASEDYPENTQRMPLVSREKSAPSSSESVAAFKSLGSSFDPTSTMQTSEWQGPVSSMTTVDMV